MPLRAQILLLWLFTIDFLLSLPQLHTKNIRNVPRSTDMESQGEDLKHIVGAGLHR